MGPVKDKELKEATKGCTEQVGISKSKMSLLLVSNNHELPVAFLRAAVKAL